MPDDEREKYIIELILKSKELKLADDPYWRTIVHYKKNFTGGFTSLIDDPLFFFSDKGKKDPYAELEATIRGFFQPFENGKAHPTVKFSARYAWLKKRLEIDVSKLPYDGDIQFERFYKQLNPSTVTLVFPAGFMGNPASMFGHTFLLIESEGGSRLLASAANYAANAEETFGTVFAFKGLFGFFKGYYSFLPYYQKIKEYSDGEMRDMWEYELSLTPEEKAGMMRHTIEMENIYSDYYFIGENCSFNLMYLIEAAKPETEITDAFGMVVEPINTIRVVKDKNLVSRRVYRPSIYSRIKYLRSKLSDNEQELVLDFCRGDHDLSGIDLMNITDEKKIIMCDLASDYLKFMAEKKDITEQNYKSRFISVLTKRNSMVKYDPIKDMPVPAAPEESHKSRRMAFKTGRSLKGFYSQLAYRQTCHEMMDTDDGYNMNSQIIFGNISGRYYYDDKKFVLQRFDIIDVTSIPPSDSYFFSTCYDLKTGLIQNAREGEMESLSYWFKGAAGLSTLLADKVQIYFFTGLKSYFSPEYQNNTDLLAGGDSGLLTILGPWKNHMFMSVYHAPFGDIHTKYSAGVSERLKISQNISFETDYSYNKDYSFYWHELSAKINFYF